MIEGHDYTIYSNGPSGRARMYGLLAIITAFLTPLVQRAALSLLKRYYRGEEWDVAQLALVFGGFTTLVLYGVLLSVFDYYLWRTRVGRLMFQVAGLSTPPNLGGDYRGNIEVQHASVSGQVFRTGYFMRIAQTWEQISILIERESEAGGHVRVHSDMATIRVGMMSEVATLRFVYTFEENLPRRVGAGTMARQFSGAATFEFRREGDGWVVEGHFFDDIGRSGQVEIKQQAVGDSHTSVPLPPAVPVNEAHKAEPVATPELPPAPSREVSSVGNEPG